MRILRISAITLTLVITAGSFAVADDDDERPAQQQARMPTTQQVYTQQQRQQQQRYYNQQQQQQSQGFWGRMMDLERRKNRFLLRMIGVGD